MYNTSASGTSLSLKILIIVLVTISHYIIEPSFEHEKKPLSLLVSPVIIL